MKLTCPGNCGLFNNMIIQPTHPKDPILMIIGEGPGKDEVAMREFFVGKTGQEMTNYLSRVGIPRERCYITNVIKCRTNEQNRDPKQSEIDACSILLIQEILEVRPRFIVTAGRISSRWMLGNVDMEQIHGIPFSVDTIFGGVELGYSVTVIPTYHPALGLHDSTNMSMIMADFRAAKDTMALKIKPRKLEDKGGGNYCYQEWDGDEDALCSDIIGIDTETQEDWQPWSVQFSCEEGSGYFIRAGDVELVRKLGNYIANPSVLTVIHNALFDVPLLQRLGALPAHYVDTMIMAYLLQTEPQGLKPLTFRHLGIRMNEYGDMVRAQSQIKALEYISLVSGYEWPNVDPILEIKGTDVRMRQPQNIGTKVKRILTDYSKDPETDLQDRWGKIDKNEGRGMVEEVLGPLYPAFLKDIPFPEAMNYACKDPDMTRRIYFILKEKIEALELGSVLERDMGVVPMVSDMQLNGMAVDIPYMKDLSTEFANNMGTLQAEINALDKDLINPGSDPQVFELLRRLRIERRPKMYKGATDHARLESLVDKYPIIDKISQFRGYKKLKSSFLDVLPERADREGRVHTTLRVTRVVTGRLSSSKPNLMAQPVRTADGRKIRGGFVSKPGFSLLSGDYSQVEMRVVAHISQDPIMMDIFTNDEDIHLATASRMFGIPPEQVDEMKHRYPAKRVGFGILNLISAGKLLRELEVGGATGWTELACQKMIFDWFGVYQGVANWIDEIKVHARRYGYVRDMWGRIRFCPELMSVHRAVVEAGIRQSVNAPIQMGAQGVIKEAMGQLVPLYKEFGEDLLPLIQIHDDLMWECRDELIPVVMPLLKDVMENCVPQMSVPLKVDFKVGKRWNEMKKWKED